MTNDDAVTIKLSEDAEHVSIVSDGKTVLRFDRANLNLFMGNLRRVSGEMDWALAEWVMLRGANCNHIAGKTDDPDHVTALCGRRPPSESGWMASPVIGNSIWRLDTCSVCERLFDKAQAKECLKL
jgi:hypothetical protein